MVPSNLTIISFCANSKECEALSTIPDMYPGVQVLVASLDGLQQSDASYQHVGKFPTKSDALNKLTKLVKTAFFLHLDTHHHLGEVGTIVWGVEGDETPGMVPSILTSLEVLPKI